MPPPGKDRRIRPALPAALHVRGAPRPRLRHADLDQQRRPGREPARHRHVAVDERLRRRRAPRLVTTDEIARLAPGEIPKLSIDDLLAEHPGAPDDQQLLCTLHMVPVDWLGNDAVDVPSTTMMAHVSASDDFIEYHQRPKGVVTGVAYQTGPLNDRRLSSTRTTVCQAPKVIVAEPVDTLMMLMNVSTSFDYDGHGPHGLLDPRPEWGARRPLARRGAALQLQAGERNRGARARRQARRIPAERRARDVPRLLEERDRRPDLPHPAQGERRDRLRPHPAADLLPLHLGRRGAAARQRAARGGVLRRRRVRSGLQRRRRWRA